MNASYVKIVSMTQEAEKWKVIIVNVTYVKLGSIMKNLDVFMNANLKAIN